MPKEHIHVVLLVKVPTEIAVSWVCHSLPRLAGARVAKRNSFQVLDKR